MPINHLILDLAGRYYSSFEMLGYEGVSVSGDSATPSVTETRDLFLPFLMASCKPEIPPSVALWELDASYSRLSVLCAPDNGCLVLIKT